MIRRGIGARAAGLLLGLLSIVGALPGERVEAQGGDPFPRVEVQLPGPLLSAAVVRLADGGHRLAVLAGPPKQERRKESDDEGSPSEEAPEAPPTERLRTLLLIDPANGRTETVAEGLPETARRLTAVPREGADDLLVVVTRGGAFPIDPTGADGKLREPVITPGTVLLPDGLAADRSGLLAVARPGTLELFRARPDGTLDATGSLPLPKRAERTRWGLRITSPPVHGLDGGESGQEGAERAAADAPGTEAGAPCWAIGPEAHGPRRLRTLLSCLGDHEQAEPVEIWSLLPDGETVTETLYTRYGDRPILVVLTRTKLGLFVKQRLRLFPLEASRNRVGAEPLLATETACPLWRGSSLGFTDVDGDGRLDLYLLCKKGLVDPELRLEVYSALGDGRFEPKSRSVELDGDYSSWSIRSDWTGDGLPDLLAVRQGEIELHPGTGTRRRPIDRSPGRRVDLGPSAADEDADEEDEVEIEIDAESDGGTEVSVHLGGPRIVGATDLTGDGRPELVVYRGGTPGGRLTILRRR